jgi:diguanylate cyclase (GGDEF)-like protein
MSPPLALAHELTPELNPFVSEIGNRLMRSFRSVPVDADRLALIEKVLAFAATAEQQLAEQKHRIAQLEWMSLTDELTGLPNRRGFQDFLRRALAAAQRHGENGMMAYVDLDNFKDINDRYGHDVGDAALRHVARILSENLRLSDFVARLHGDEFALVLVRASAAQGASRARRLQQQIHETPLRHGSLTLTIQASFGIAAYGRETEPADLLRRADRAMYEEKRARLQLATAGAAE